MKRREWTKQELDELHKRQVDASVPIAIAAWRQLLEEEAAKVKRIPEERESA